MSNAEKKDKDMALTCKQVWGLVSDYLEGTLATPLRDAMTGHLVDCPRCTAIVNGVRNIIDLVADGRIFALPAGFSERLKDRLKKELDLSQNEGGGPVLLIAADEKP
jgi:hypothetical protein